MSSSEKILILRFSSFGDVVQALSLPTKMKERFPNCEIHWAVREDLSSLLEGHPHITKVWKLPRHLGFQGLWALTLELAQIPWARVYDAHNNLRSLWIGWALRLKSWTSFRQMLFLKKSQKRWKRFLLFQFRLDLYEKPLSGQRDLIEPLAAWGISRTLPQGQQLFLKPQDFSNLESRLPKSFIALAPSAAYELKKWPLQNFKTLISILPQQNFVLLGGPEDKYLQELTEGFSERVTNLAGSLSLRESAAVVARSELLVANDTGLLHVGEQLDHPTIALMGPAPFGYPSREQTKIMALNLKCRPCSKHGQGPCINPNFHQCLRDISPEQVKREIVLFKQGSRF